MRHFRISLYFLIAVLVIMLSVSIYKNLLILALVSTGLILFLGFLLLQTDAVRDEVSVNRYLQALKQQKSNERAKKLRAKFRVIK